MLGDELKTIAIANDKLPAVTGLPKPGVGNVNNPYYSHPGLIRAGLGMVERPLGRLGLRMRAPQETLMGDVERPAVPTEPYAPAPEKGFTPMQQEPEPPEPLHLSTLRGSSPRRFTLSSA